MDEPQTAQEYERRYMQNYEVSGFGIDGVTNHFPCPFCAAGDWHVVRLVEFGESTDPIECKECGRAARFVVGRDASSTTMGLVQTAGPDPAPWVPIPREADADAG